MGYKELREEERLGDMEWWYKVVWKFKCPLKTKQICGWFLGTRFQAGITCKEGTGRNLVDVFYVRFMRNPFIICPLLVIMLV